MRDRGQASLEILAGVPVMVLGMMVALQLAITGYSLHLADGAAEAGALAVAAGADPEAAARASLPGWTSGSVEIETDGGRVSVAVRPPAPLPALSTALEVEAEAWARSRDD